ncbi:MAG: hypothetical protein ABI813_08815 [Bacteroidota bacterium]
MKKLSILITLSFVLAFGHCQLVRSPLQTPYTAIGSCSKSFTDAFSGSANQAVLAEVRAPAAGVYGERRFMLRELSNYQAALVWPAAGGGMGIVARYFGGTHFNASQFGLGYGKKLGSKIDIGLQFNYNMIKLPGYGGSAAINAEAGILLHLTDRVHVGIQVYNPVGGKFSGISNEKLASVYTSGIGYEVSDKFFIGAAISKEENQPVSIHAGMQYVFENRFFARAGIATGAADYFFGLGLQWSNFRLDVATAWHAQLGYTPAIMLLFNLNKSGQQHQP